MPENNKESRALQPANPPEGLMAVPERMMAYPQFAYAEPEAEEQSVPLSHYLWVVKRRRW